MRAFLRSACLGLALISPTGCASTDDGDAGSIPFLDSAFDSLGKLGSNDDELNRQAREVYGIRSEDQIRSGSR